MLQSQNLEKEELIIEKETQNQNQPDQKEKENSNLNPKKINIIDDIEFEIQIDPELLINKTTELDDYICPLCKGLFLNPLFVKIGFKNIIQLSINVQLQNKI